MPFGIRINIATAAMEDIYERLCWVYTTLHYTMIYDHKGEAQYLVYISELLKGKIPYPEQFSKKPDYEQGSLILDLRMKDILCTRTDWINHERDPSGLEICQYADGDEKYISIEGIPYQDPVHRPGYLIRRVQSFPTYLLEPSYRVIGVILEEQSL